MDRVVTARMYNSSPSVSAGVCASATVLVPTCFWHGLEKNIKMALLPALILAAVVIDI